MRSRRLSCCARRWRAITASGARISASASASTISWACRCAPSSIPAIPVVMSHGAYPTFAFHVSGFGGRFVHAPYRDDRNDAEALAAGGPRDRQPPRLSLQSRQSDRKLARRPRSRCGSSTALPPGAVLVLDEAYSDFAPPGTLARARSRGPARHPPAHLFQGARHGRHAHRLCHRAGRDRSPTFDKIRHHFGVSRLAQEAALASLGDQRLHRRGGRARSPAGRADYCQARRAARAQGAAVGHQFRRHRHGLGRPRAGDACALLLEEEACFLRMPGRGAARPAHPRHGRHRRGARAALPRRSRRILPKLPA